MGAGAKLGGIFKATYNAGGRLDPPFYPTKTEPFIKGIRIEILSDASLSTNIYQIEKASELISVAIACKSYYDKDNWDLVINGVTIVESCYTKELPEGLFLMVAHPLKTGDTIEFRFKNEAGKLNVAWVNYQFLTAK